MVILGKKYTFTKYEMQKLNKTFKKIDYIDTENIENLKKLILNILKSENKKLIVLNTSEKHSDKLISFLTSLELKGIKFLTIEHFLEKYLYKIYIPNDNSDLSFLDEIKPFTKWQYFQKRIIDFFIAIPLGILTLPIIFYSAYRIKKESPDGNIFFKQTRIGRNAKPFTCVKFRTMKTNIDFFNHYTQENDPRIFPYGEFMRKTRIDELPQLANVFKGEMHIIGPRAEWNELVKKYENVWPYYHSRHLIAPGITGWAQVNYPYGKNLEDTKQKLMYDLYYIKNWSLWLEIKTIFKTIWVMVGGKGL